MILASGTILNNTYQIMDRIGAGGVGIIYRAYHLRLQKYIVIKMIKENFVGNINVRGEADILKKLRHPCLPQVYDFVQIDTQVYTVMDYISGYDLETYVKNGYQITQTDIEKWLEQLCEALVYLHKQKPAIIHSDIKPQNIIIDNEGNANLIDFNISFDEDTINLQGVSASYASYEQLEAADLIRKGYAVSKDMIDVTTDIYSLGATFYYIMSGFVPYAGIIETYPLTALDIPYAAALVKIIDKSMQREKNKRYSTASRMLSDVRSLKKKTVEYHLKRAGIIIGIICAATIISVTVYWGISSVQKKNLSVIEAQYQEISGMRGYTREEQAAISKFLEDSNNASYLEKRPDKKAALVYSLGNYYFFYGDYKNAMKYYKEAVDLDTAHADYWRDYAICLARDNQLEQASLVLEEAGSYGMDSQNIREVQCEISFAKGEIENAMQDLAALLKEPLDTALQNRCIALYAKTCWQLQNYDACIRYLNELTVNSENEDIRILAVMNTYINYAGSSGNMLVREDCYINVAAYYNKIQDISVCSLSDRLNAAIAFENIRQYDNAINILSALENENEQDYRIYMQLALCYYEKEKDNGRDYSKVRSYYQTAEQLYRAAGAGGRDSDMKRLEDIVRQLK